MNDFLFYLKEGVNHILDPDGLDHFYFILSFCILYTFNDWRKIVGLVTAFTVGHCVTLFLSGLELVSINANTVELLIPITILLSCVNNFWFLVKDKPSKQQLTTTYIILLVFGLIHGLGFSNYIKMMIFDDESIVLPLLGFNVGIELAQLLIVAGFLALISISTLVLKSKIKWLRFAVNVIIFFLVLQMILSN
ncbi:HupE / UreJ protein [Formosa sp. Hel1_31_208]|uniref:HupE/UreJ family protein n=1 Tax=Formosa sp. Hel1_31_208 TaxID=1798225 RepID=UPI00087BF8CA|nr:HupE/UreJ family protein [Formosa sp. Hel1_31_208]SDS59714.1 HupE / UreJ protein [Formosa sp. Hel1_31_208]